MFKKGFTLVEILIVVVILASVVAFGVPSYRKAQIRSRFNAALGTLTQLGGGINNLYSDIQTYSGNSWTYAPEEEGALTHATWTTSAFNSNVRDLSLTRWGQDGILPDGLDWNKAFVLALVVREYMPPLKLGTGISAEVIPYNHYICNPNLAGEAKLNCGTSGDNRTCCAHNTNRGGTVACMILKPSYSSEEERSYAGARFYRDGTYNVLSCKESDPDE